MSSPADRDLDLLVEAHRIASNRRKRGLPVWDETVDVSSVWNLPEFTDVRDGVVRILKASKWYANAELGGELHDVVAEIAESSDTEEFDWAWRAIYDLADVERIWIKVR